MSALTLPTTRLHTTPVHLSFSNDSQAFVTIYGDGFVEVWDWPLVVELPRGKAREVAAPRLVRSFGLAAKGEGEEDGVQTKQVACVGGGESLVLAVLRATRTGSEVVLVDAKGGVEKLEIPGGAKRIVAGQEGFVLESGDGTILERELFITPSVPPPVLTLSSSSSSLNHNINRLPTPFFLPLPPRVLPPTPLSTLPPSHRRSLLVWTTLCFFASPSNRCHFPLLHRRFPHLHYLLTRSEVHSSVPSR